MSGLLQWLLVGVLVYALVLIFAFPIICPSARFPFERRKKEEP